MKRTLKNLFPVILVMFLSLGAHGQSAASQTEPTFAEILTAFFREQHLSFSGLDDLKSRARKAVALPALSLGYDHQLRNTESLAITDNISVSGGRVTIGPEDNNLNQWNNLGRSFHVRAAWRLDGLLFHRAELDVLRLRREMIKLRQHYARELYRIFETRALCRARYWQKPDSKKAVMYRAQFNALTEELDALTELVFHKKWRRL